MIPLLLFRAQARLGLKPTELILILHPTEIEKPGGLARISKKKKAADE